MNDAEKIATLEAENTRLLQEREARFDCHAGPGTATPACGTCTTCLLREVEKNTPLRDRVAALEKLLSERVGWMVAKVDLYFRHGLTGTVTEAHEVLRMLRGEALAILGKQSASAPGVDVTAADNTPVDLAAENASLKQERDAAKAKLAVALAGAAENTRRRLDAEDANIPLRVALATMQRDVTELLRLDAAGVVIWHTADVAWRATCGADVPNQRTTVYQEHVTCPMCLRLRAASGKLQPFHQQPECRDNAPATFTGHWREWHRGHRCDKDPETPAWGPSPKAPTP